MRCSAKIMASIPRSLDKRGPVAPWACAGRRTADFAGTGRGGET
ncbi:MAG: hypothetical protein Q8K82_16110 [Gemmatimonadaceae bacterium]|nr:hypothetical protein [Gemmatimonadaceae bacterium]